MARALERTKGAFGFLAGVFSFGLHGGKIGSVVQMVHDGDTMNVATANNFAVRYLGVDTPEVTYHKPALAADPQAGQDTSVSPAGPDLSAMLADPFSPKYVRITGLSRALRDALAARASANAGSNHRTLAEDAHRKLEALINDDLTELGLTNETVRLFLAFAYEALDGYGRFLCYVHPDQKDVPSAQRKKSYNERMLATGYSAPYFIFPNVDPFRSQGSPLKAARLAQSPQNILHNAPRLRDARAAAKAARDAGLGIHQPANTLIFDAFELRFLADRRAPNRWIINLAGDDRVLHHPQTYLGIPHAEDRLWVPEEFVPVFESAGWLPGASPTDMEQ